MIRNEITLAEVADALEWLNANDRILWFKMAFAIKDHFGEAGFDVWDRWSQMSNVYSARAARTTWRNAKDDKAKKITIGSLMFLAKQEGWTREKFGQKPKFTATPKPAPKPNKPVPNPAKAVERIWSAWEGANPISPVIPGVLQAYLASRGLGGLTAEMIGPNVRLHPDHDYFDEDASKKRLFKVGAFPTVLFAYRMPGGELVTLHRLYLSKKGGKAEVAEPKKLMAVPGDRSLLGASLMMPGRSGRGSGIYHIAEGFETAASVLWVYDSPTFSVGTTALLEAFQPPDDCKMLFIWADKDRSKAGEKSAEMLKQKMLERGIPAITLYPKDDIPAGSKGVDWNDVLQRHGPEGFPPGQMLAEVVRKASAFRKAV